MSLKSFNLKLNSGISPFKKTIKVDSDKSISQNPVFIGSDLKRVLLDLR